MSVLDFHAETTFSKTWPRILFGWLLLFLTRIGFLIGWTIITAIVVSTFGIANLPIVYLTHAGLIICGALIYTTFIHKIKIEMSLISAITGAAIALFTAILFSNGNTLLFLGLLLIAGSLFLAQIAINLSIYIEDLFTPMEFEKAAPVIESAETIAGISGGLIVTTLAEKINVNQFIAIWIIALVIMVPIIILFWDIQNRIPVLRFKKQTPTKNHVISTLKEGVHVFNKTKFLKTLVILVACQWLVLNILEFQYTKTIEQHLTQIEEETLAAIPRDSWMVSIPDTPAASVETEKKTTIAHAEITKITEQEIAKLLGMMYVIFSFSALAMQVFGVRKIIKTLGLANSALIHPIVTIISITNMMLNFGLVSSVSAKTGFEMTSTLFLHSYHASFYALKHHLRTYAKEFLEGIVKPLGALCGVGIIILAQHISNGPEMTLLLNLIMMGILGIMIISLFPLQQQYTQMAQQHLFLPGLHPAKLDAIEILSQRGHSEPGILLAYSLRNTTEEDLIRIKILKTLGKIQDPETIPEILEALESGNDAIKWAAIEALRKFKNLHTDLIAHAFSRHRIISVLKHVFNQNNTEEVRSGVIELLARFNEEETIRFLIEILNSNNEKMIIDALQACRVFKDPNAAYYLTQFLQSENPQIKAHAIIALWHFKKYRPKIQKAMLELKNTPAKENTIALLLIIGELRLIKEKEIMEKGLQNSDIQIRFEAALALAQCNSKKAIPVLAQFLLESTHASHMRIKQILAKTPPAIRNKIQNILEKKVVERINTLLNDADKKGENTLNDLATTTLQKLEKYYTLVDKDRECARIEEILAKRRHSLSFNT